MKPKLEETLKEAYVYGIDLGSNTLRAVSYDCQRGEFVAEYEKIVRTADGLIEHKKILEATKRRIINAILEAKKNLGFKNGSIKAVATEALRRASNREEIVCAIKEESGISFEVIDGEEEARLSLLAVRRRLKRLGIEDESFVMVDIGGGSTEIIFQTQKEVISRSFPLGIVTLSQEAKRWEAIPSLISKYLPAIEEFIKERRSYSRGIERFVATAGTPTTVAALKLGMDYESYDRNRVNGARLNRLDLRQSLDRLLAMTPKERQRAVGVGRDDLIASGILIFEAIFDLLEARECIVIDDGLREGAALSLCEERKRPQQALR